MGSASHSVTRQPGSAQNVGPFINVITWILLITSALAVLTRLVTKRALRRRIDIDDVFVVDALILSIGSGIAVCVQTANGLGRDASSLDDDHFVAYEKAEYANKLLYIATLASAKISIVSLLLLLTASEGHRRVGISLAAFIAVWGLVSVLTAAFQCSRSEPWRAFGAEARCYDMTAFWRATGVINMLTDLALILFPVHVIATLQMSIGKKLTILVFFGARSLDIIACGIQLAYTSAFRSTNPTLALWKWVLTTQITQCITILTSCVPYLRPLLESMPTGMYGADELRRRGTPSSLGYGRSKTEPASFKLSNTSSQSQRSRNQDGSARGKRLVPALALAQHATASSNSASGVPNGPRRPDGETLDVRISAPKAGLASGEGKWETDSQGSQAKMIKKTTVVRTAWERTEGEAGRDEDRSRPESGDSLE